MTKVNNVDDVSEPKRYSGDSGFPVGGGGRRPVRGESSSDMAFFPLKMCVKTKELGPVGGMRYLKFIET